MARIQIGGDPESYMDPPTLSIGGNGGGGGSGVNLVNGLFDLLGIHRRVELGPKERKLAPKKVKTVPVESIKPASDFLDETGSALAKQDLANYKPVGLVDLPPSMFAK